MPSRPANALRRPWRGLAALTVLALTPKCVVCLAAYLGLVTALGLGGPEICGASSNPSHAHVALLIASTLFVLTGIACFVLR